MWDKAGDLLFGLGLPGLVILVLGATVYYLFQQNLALQKLIFDLQDKRVSERETVIQALIKSTDAMEEVAKATDANNRAIDANTRLLQMRGSQA